MKDEDKRLIEDYLPIQAISAKAFREKSVRKGHISTGIYGRYGGYWSRVSMHLEHLFQQAVFNCLSHGANNGCL
jgi:hypothetical protein